MKNNVLNLADYRMVENGQVSKVLVGKNWGKYVREHSRLDEMERLNESVTIINGTILEHIIEFKMKFIDILQAINSTVYNSILEETNKLQDKLTLATFGEDGINLSNLSDFERFIKSPISKKCPASYSHIEVSK